MSPAEAVPDELVDIVVALCLAGAGVHAQQRAIAAQLDAGRVPHADRLLEDMYADLRDRPPSTDVARVRTALSVRGVDVLVPGAPSYPSTLFDAWPDLGAPLWLFRSGAAAPPHAAGRGPGRPDGRSRTGAPAVAVVGTRRPTADGLRVAEALAGALGRAGAVVISGMALGIDQAAHAAALAVGGHTAAVLGTGHGVDYPRRSEDLRSAVSRSGGLFSELLPGTPPRPHHFLARNRIISGLADVTVVVEGRARSGALQTARMAAAQGRDVWAVPGSLNAPASQAPLALIRDGAKVVTRVEDVVEALGPSPHATAPSAAGDAHNESAERAIHDQQLSVEDAAILDLLGTVAISVDELVVRTGHPAAHVMARVGRLRRLGLADTEPGGVVATNASSPSATGP